LNSSETPQPLVQLITALVLGSYMGYKWGKSQEITCDRWDLSFFQIFRKQLQNHAKWNHRFTIDHRHSSWSHCLPEPPSIYRIQNWLRSHKDTRSLNLKFKFYTAAIWYSKYNSNLKVIRYETQYFWFVYMLVTQTSSSTSKQIVIENLNLSIKIHL
jgi:hypothetical protein